MRKLAAARQHLMDRLGIAADNLLSFAREGSVVSHRAPDARSRNGHFGLRYEAHFIVTDYAGAPVDLFWTMLAWLHTDNPGITPDALKFHADILDHRRADVSLQVEMTETVRVEPIDGGTFLRPSVDADALAFDMFDIQPPAPPAAAASAPPTDEPADGAPE